MADQDQIKRFEILMLEMLPSGVEHMGAVEMILEPREQHFAETPSEALARARSMVREWRDKEGTQEAWNAAYEPLEALGALSIPGDGLRAGPFGREGLEVLVRRSPAVRDSQETT